MSSILIRTLWRPIFLNCNYDINDYSFSSPFDIELYQENMKVREVIPHIGPIPIVIPLRLFLDYINFPRIMLPRALRGTFVEERKCSNMPAVRTLR